MDRQPCPTKFFAFFSILWLDKVIWFPVLSSNFLIYILIYTNTTFSPFFFCCLFLLLFLPSFLTILAHFSNNNKKKKKKKREKRKEKRWIKATKCLTTPSESANEGMKDIETRQPHRRRRNRRPFNRRWGRRQRRPSIGCIQQLTAVAPLTRPHRPPSSGSKISNQIIGSRSFWKCWIFWLASLAICVAFLFCFSGGFYPISRLSPPLTPPHPSSPPPFSSSSGCCCIFHVSDWLIRIRANNNNSNNNNSNNKSEECGREFLIASIHQRHVPLVLFQVTNDVALYSDGIINRIASVLQRADPNNPIQGCQLESIDYGSWQPRLPPQFHKHEQSCEYHRHLLSLPPLLPITHPPTSIPRINRWMFQLNHRGRFSA